MNSSPQKSEPEKKSGSEHSIWELWKGDLEHSRELDPRQKRGYSLLVSWYLGWIEYQDMLPGRESAVVFWRESVLRKEREQWQLEQWGEAMGWFLNWVQVVERARGLPVGPSLPMRVRRAVMTTGARRGLRRTTCKSYASACARLRALRCVLRECEGGDERGAGPGLADPPGDGRKGEFRDAEGKFKCVGLFLSGCLWMGGGGSGS